MNFRNKLVLSGVSLALAASVAPIHAALAQAPAAQASMTAGATVKDTTGGTVGTIKSVDGDYVILKTDKHEVRLPAASFTAVEDGYIMAMSQADVNAAVERTLAAAEDLMKVGAIVKDPAGGTVGTIEAIDDQFVTVKLSGTSVKLARSAFTPTPSGPLIALTAAELEAKVAATTAPAEAPPVDAEPA